MWWGDLTSSHLSTNPQFSCGAAIPPRPTLLQTISLYVVGRSHLVPPFCKPSGFIWCGDPTSSHLFTHHQFLCGGTTPSRPTFVQTLSFHVAQRSHLVPLCYKPSVFMWWDDPTSFHISTNPQFSCGAAAPPLAPYMSPPLKEPREQMKQPRTYSHETFKLSLVTV